MNNIIFDQYQRYKSAEIMINHLRPGSEKLKILEVGANEHQNLERFLPNDEITYLDISLPDELLSNPKYVLGDATKMDFCDESFDIVVALDVFEHIPSELREQFLSELTRVSSLGFVLTAPFHSYELGRAEQRVNAVYKALHGKDFIWLQEHFDNGLPVLDETLSFLTSNKIKFKTFSHGDLDIWERMMNVHFVAAADTRLNIYRDQMDIYYNSQIYPFDYSDKAYRQIIIASKYEENLEAIPLQTEGELEFFDKLERLKAIEGTFFRIKASLIPLEDKCVEEHDYVQVYVDEGTGFNEKSSYKLIYNDTSSHYTFYFEPKTIKAFRIDPSYYKGVFRISNIRLFADDGSEVKYVEIDSCPNVLSKNTYVFNYDDPNLHFELEHMSSISKISLECEHLIGSKPYWLIDVMSEIKHNIVSEIKQTDEKARADYEALHRQIEDISSENSGLKEQYSSLREQYLGLEEQCLSARHNAEVWIDKYNYLKEKQRVDSLEIERLNDEINQIYSTKAWKYIERIRRVIKK
ncbi:class I SAM-dependent methyltransferase [Paenibacillus arenosi]|uniref:Methyltransferase domain-containing protein n=1 Tax=Paenibacillus arenosi TaxID=2774142 RepID=A0ABR9B6H1_9BACL|nr:class I SAM-dependent methyltransferase [Paenibacillus arenosi]MBD8500992.1 methyltransferase domain-containing protein [Paenibacillus arenosi]